MRLEGKGKIAAVRFRRNAPLDPGQVTDLRGRRGVGPIAVGGGGLGVVGLVIYLLIALLSGGNALAQLAPLEGQQVGQGDAPADISRECKTGQDANERQDCRIVAVVNSVQKFWDGVFQRSNRQYQYVDTVFFTDSIQTGCGYASSAVGPFYCPASRKLFVDPTFFDELERKLGGSKADFSKAYVIAHEVGHHVQNLLGYTRLVNQYRQREGENAGIRLELQADYLAGVCWNLVESKRRILETGDIEAAITTAKAIGDDRLQKKSGGWVNPESFNHGTADQRLKYFMAGFKTGDASKRALDHFFATNVKPLDL